MNIKAIFNLPIDVDVRNKPIFYENIKIGKITDSYFKNEQMYATLKINKKYKSFFKKRLQPIHFSWSFE